MGSLALLYAGGLFSQVMTNYRIWLDSGGMLGQALMAPPKFNPFICWLKAFSWNGLIGMGLISAGIAGLWIYYRLQDRFSGRIDDPRGFSISKTGT